MTINFKNLWAGLLFVGLGLFFALQSWLSLRIGTAVNMGPGYFPLVLGGVLMALGTAIGFGSLGRPNEPLGRVSWCGLLLVMAAVLFFAITVRGLGFAPALTGAGLLAALSSGKLNWPAAIALSLAIAAFGSLVFVFALRLPYPLIGRWIMG